MARRSRLRWLFWPVMMIVGLAVAVRSDRASDIACRVLEGLIEAVIGERATIARLSIEPTRIALLDIDIAHPATNDAIFHADAVTFALGWDPAAGPLPGFGAPVLRTLALVRPQLALHLDADGLREFRNTTDLATGGDDAEPMASFPWRDLRVVQGRIHVDGPGWSTTVDGIDLTPVAHDRADLTLGDVRVTAGDVDLHQSPAIFRNILLTPSRVALPDIRLRFAPGTEARNAPVATLDGNLDAWLGTALNGGLSLRLDLPGLTPGLPPANTTRPADGWSEGVVFVDATLSGTPDKPTVEGMLAVNDLTLHRGFPRKLGDIAGAWHLDLGGAAPHILVDNAGMVWGPGTLGIDADLNVGDGTLSAAIRAENISLARILSDVSVAPTPWVDFTADVEANVTGALSPFRLDGPFEIAVTELEVGDAPIGGPHTTMLAVPRGSLLGDLVITGDHLVLDVHHLRAGRTHGRIMADIGFLEVGPLHVDIDLPELDLSWLTPLNDLGLAGMAGVRGVLSGPITRLGVDGSVTVNGMVVFGLPLADTLKARFSTDLSRLDFDEIDAWIGQTRYIGHFGIDLEHDERIDTDLTITEGRAKDLTGIFVDLGDFDAEVTGDISLTGTPYRLEGPSHLTLGPGNLWGEPTSSGLANGTMVDGELRLDELRITRSFPEPAPALGSKPAAARPRDAVLRARGSVKRGFVLNMEVLSDGLTVERLAHAEGLGITGDVIVDAQIGGTLYDWEPRGRVALRHIHVFGEPIAETTLRFATTHVDPDTANPAGGDTLAWTADLLGGAGTASGNIGLHGQQPYDLTARFLDFPFAFFHPRAPDGSPISATLTGSLDLRGQLGDHPTPADIDGTLDSVRLGWRDHQLHNAAPWSFSLHDREFDVPPVTLIGNDGTRVEFSGRAAPNARAEAEGLPPVLFEGSGKVNLDLLRAVVPGLEESRGMADVTVKIDSQAPNPVEVSAKLRNATLRTAYFPATFDDLSANLVGTAAGYTFTKVRASVGGGTFCDAANTDERCNARPGSGEPSSIDAEGWVPTRYALHGRLKDTRVQYLDYLPPIRGDATLAFDGPVGDLLLGGEISIAEMEWKDRVDWESEVVSLREEHLTAAAPDPNDNYFGMDLAVRTPRGSSTLKLRNNVADADASCDLRIVGDTARPGMVGDIRLDPGGSMYLNDREFEIYRGEIRYIDPFTFDPDIDLMLGTEVRSQEQDYRITYLVNGPFSDWRTTTTSDPYLSQADINALLLFGVTREDLERTGGLGTALLVETSDLLLGQTPLSRANFFVVDRWNLVSGVTERGTPTVSSDLRLVAQKQLYGFDVTMETALGQNLGRDWYLSVERRIAQKLYLAAWLATEQEGRTLPIGAAYGLDLKLRVEGD